MSLDNLRPIALLALTLSVVAADAQTVKIGVQLPVTGERSSVGRLMLNGLQMAVDDANARPGSVRFELKLADDESDTGVAAAALDRLIQDSSVAAVIGEINSPMVMAGAQLVEKAGIPYLTAGSNPNTTAASSWIFRVGASDTLLAGFVTRYLIEELKIREIAIVHDKTGVHNQRALAIGGMLEKQYQAKPLLDASWGPADRTLTAQMDQLKASGAKAVVALGETPDGGKFFRDLKASGNQLQVIGQRDFGARRVLEEAGDAASGALIFTEYAPELQAEATRTWNDTYRRRYSNDANVIAVQYYDALMLIAEAVKTSGTSRAEIKSGLERLKNFHGVLADYTFDRARNGVHRLFVTKIVSGKLTLVKTLEE